MTAVFIKVTFFPANNPDDIKTGMDEIATETGYSYVTDDGASPTRVYEYTGTIPTPFMEDVAAYLLAQCGIFNAKVFSFGT